jgi:hypothetical protein
VGGSLGRKVPAEQLLDLDTCSELLVEIDEDLLLLVHAT